MWNPKRIIMLSGCFVAFFVAYLGYACTALGRMDGLPPLPEAYWPNPTNDMPVPAKADETPLARKIKLAFGPKCEELNRPIRLDLASRSMVLCADQFEIREGKVYLIKLSLAMFGKERVGGQPVEINTISGENAMLTFDRPVSSFSEISNRKIAEAEIQGKIEIYNNRKRVERDEDLHVHIPTGPLYYRDATHRVWTEDQVKMTDNKSKPIPHTITGKGMEMELRTEAAGAPAHPGHKPGKESISGVNWIVLQASVVMDLYTEGKGGLVGNGPQTPPEPSKPRAAKSKPAHTKSASAKSASAGAADRKDAEKAHVHIETLGPFRYEIYKDHDVARFDIPKPTAGKAPGRPPQVTVDRTLASKHDQLVCHHLTLRMRRKEGAAAENTPASENKAAQNKSEEGAEIETIHATGPQGDVILTSDAEKLDAHCSDLYHDSVKGETILKDPKEVIVHKEDNDIHARELHIQDVKPPRVPGQPEPKIYQDITAKGPGHIRMVDKEKPAAPATGLKHDQPKGPKVQHAYWQELLTFSKDNGLDLLVLTGKARFIDEQAEQSLQADTLKVWLEEDDKSQSTPAAAAKKPKGATAPEKAGKGGADKAANAMPAVASGRKPSHVEAIGDVTARARDANIHDTGRLVAWFTDVPPEMHMPSAAVPAVPGEVRATADRRPAATTVPGGGAGRMNEKGSGKSDEVTPRRPQPMPRGPQASSQLTSKSGEKHAAGPELPAANNTPPPPRPFDLTARSVEVKVLRSEIKSTIDELWCEGNVAVKQDPPTAAEKGTDVKGDTLKMTARGQDLYLLVVTGDLADLQTDKIRILGPEVNIDQSTNKAWVYGKGAMTMESATNFQGDTLKKPVPLTVQWEKSMLFNGTSAEYLGNIEATQEKARLACQRLHVFFDRTISLKEGNKSDEPAQVRELVCDHEVRIDDSVYEGDVLKMIRKIRCPGLQMISLLPDDELPIAASAQPRPAESGVAKSTKKDPKAKTSDGNIVHSTGPGTVCIVKRGGLEEETNTPGKTKNSPGGNPATNPANPSGHAADGKPHAGKAGAGKGGHAKDPASEELKLTYVEYGQRMDANSKTNIVQFWGGARVLDMPCKDPEMTIDLDAILAVTLPEKAMFLRCERLKVLDHPTDGKPNKQMEAEGRVYIQGREFYARADSAKYNDQKQQIILFGGDGYALLYRQDAPGARPSVVEAKKIIYTKTTGVTEAFGVLSSSGDTMPKSTTPAPGTRPGMNPATRPGMIPGGMPPR